MANLIAKLIVILFLISPFICIPSGIVMIRSGDTLLGIFYLLVGSILPGIYLWYFLFGRKAEKKKQAEQAEIAKAEAEKKRIEEDKERERIARLNQSVREGTWSFPAEKFYLRCYDSHATVLDNEFGFQKARMIAEQLIKEYPIELSNCGEYLKKESLESFLKEGKALAGESAIRAKEAEERKIQKQKQPRNAVPTAEENECIKKAAVLFYLHGCNKRISMLTASVNDYNTEIQGVSKKIETLFGMKDLPASLKKKERDWAVTGGIADGLAGPAVGVIAAGSTVTKNQEIRAHNAHMDELSEQVKAAYVLMVREKRELEGKRDKINKKLEEARSKVVLSKPDAAEIRKNIDIGETTVKKNRSGVLTITVPITVMNTLKLDIPDNVQMVVDGTLKAEVYFEDRFVDTVYFPLPLEGISCNTSEKHTLEGMCGRSVEYNGEYTVKFSDEQKLWVMEA